MLTREQKAMWVAALRSDQYKQTNGCLKDETGHCCLGVLLDVLQPARWTPNAYGQWWHPLAPDSGHISPALLSSEEQDYLIELNDNDVPFPTIAGYIEEKVDVTPVMREESK